MSQHGKDQNSQSQRNDTAKQHPAPSLQGTKLKGEYALERTAQEKEYTHHQGQGHHAAQGKYQQQHADNESKQGAQTPVCFYPYGSGCTTFDNNA